LATDNEQLVLSISADTRQIQRQLKSLVGQTQANTKAIEDAFSGIDKASSGAFDRVAANSNRAFTTAEQGARRYQNAMRESSLQTGNLAAQLNDISVQLAGGQSPFLIALQQGTQITQALGSGVGARGAVAALGGAFTSLLNPVSLATIAIIGLGGTAIQYFSDLISDGEDSKKVLEEQAKLIQAVADRWGDAVPALREYADEVKRAQESAAAQEGLKLLSDKTLEGTRKSVDNALIIVADLVSQLQAAGEETESITALQSAFRDFASAADDGSLKVEDVQRVQDALAAAINSTGIPALAEFKAMFDKVSTAALGTSDSVRQAQEALAQAQAKMNDPNTWRGRDLIGQTNGAMQGSSDPDLPFEGPTIDRRPLIELEGLPGDKKAASRASSEREKAAKETEREKKAVVDLIEQLEFEQSLIGMTSAERAEANALRRAGSAATDEQRAKISQLVEATYAEREAIKANEEAMRELQDVSRDVLQGIVSDLRSGKSGADILANALDRVIDRLAESAIDSFIGGFGGSGSGASGGKGLFGGAIIPGILHSGGIAGSDGYGHGRSVSPSVFNGAPRYHSGGIAGLKPDEVPAILQRGERVIPRGQSSGTGTGFSLMFAPVLNAEGADKAEVAMLRRDLAKMKAELPRQVVKTVENARNRRSL
jgi:hypothetical protein